MQPLPNQNAESDIERQLIQLWQSQGRISELDIQRATALLANARACLSETLVTLGMISEAERSQGIAQLLGYKLVQNAQWPKFPLEECELSIDFLREYKACPVLQCENDLHIAMANPQNSYALQAIALATGYAVQPLVASSSEISKQLDRLYGAHGAVDGSTADGGASADNGLAESDDIEQLKDMAQEAPVVRLVNQIIQRAIEWRASDIHIEPFEQSVLLRYRLDGVLQSAEPPPAALLLAITSRLKIMAKLNIAERRLPQDGRMMVRMQGRTVDLRVSILPTAFGESVVMRLLDRASLVLNFQDMGFSETAHAHLHALLARPNGIVLVTGPTGSGKTTTLYGAISQLNQEGVKIVTVEDPIEYQISGVNQVQVKPAIGLDFAHALRAIVRQDPDIVMIGEIRDAETARIAMQSALTGHLVLSTLHTNSAVSSIARLQDMGIEPYLINATVNGVLAQRLVRVLNPDFSESYQASAELIARWRLRDFQESGPIVLYRPQPNVQGHEAYKGRTVISEILLMNDALREAVLQQAGQSQLQKIVSNQGHVTLWQDGIQKALRGITSLEEIVRVCQGSNA